MRHPAGSIYEVEFIRGHLKFKVHGAQTEIAPSASQRKKSLMSRCLSLSLSADTGTSATCSPSQSLHSLLVTFPLAWQLNSYLSREGAFQKLEFHKAVVKFRQEAQVFSIKRKNVSGMGFISKARIWLNDDSKAARCIRQKGLKLLSAVWSLTVLLTPSGRLRAFQCRGSTV